jgi:endonuclease I
MTAKPQYSIWYVLKGLFCTALFYGASYYIPNFTAAKMYLKNLHGEHFSHTFYGDIPFDAQGITLLCPEGWSEEDCRLEWDHIVPASFLAKNLPCWSQDSCPFHENWSHRRCCQETSMEFTFREANVANIMPALRKLNREKSNFLPGIVKNHRRVKVLCGVKIDPKNKIFEPCDHRKGWTARIYLEMDALYHLPFTAQQKQMLQNWDQKFPMEADEKRHNELLKQSA